MELDGKRVILLTENMFNDLEFWYPYYRLKEAGASVTVVGSTPAAYTGKAGTPQCDPDSLIQGHAIWHLLSALATWSFFLFLRTERQLR